MRKLVVSGLLLVSAFACGDGDEATPTVTAYQSGCTQFFNVMQDAEDGKVKGIDEFVQKMEEVESALPVDSDARMAAEQTASAIASEDTAMFAAFSIILTDLCEENSEQW